MKQGETCSKLFTEFALVNFTLVLLRGVTVCADTDGIMVHRGNLVKTGTGWRPGREEKSPCHRCFTEITITDGKYIPASQNLFSLPWNILKHWVIIKAKNKETPDNSNDVFGPSWSTALASTVSLEQRHCFNVQLLNLKVNLCVEDQTLTSVLCSSQTKASEELPHLTRRLMGQRRIMENKGNSDLWKLQSGCYQWASVGYLAAQHSASQSLRFPLLRRF